MKKNRKIYEDASLLRKMMTATASESELAEAQRLLQERPELLKHLKEVQKSVSQESLVKSYRNQGFSAQHAFLEFRMRIQNRGVKRSRKKANLIWYSAAAAAILFAITFSLRELTSSPPLLSKATAIIEPGQAKGSLLLPNGEALEIKQKNIAMTIGNIHVSYKNGALAYTPIKTGKTINPGLLYHRFTTPRGGENKLILSDGTQIHMNADSKIIYPMDFTGNDRTVVFDGEAFFNVTKDPKHPFTVKTPYGDVRVLGTSFNVNSYRNEGVCYITLVTGKVEFTTEDKRTISLLPGEQAVITAQSAFKRKVDVENYTSWTTGIYTFKDESIGNIMYTFERWYNIRAKISDPSIYKLKYTGNVRRDITINSFLDAFELIGDITYQINGRDVILTRKRQE